MLLQLSHVYKIYGELHAVDDLSLDVERGEWLAVVGSSGSGKTTLMNIIGCMDTPSKGTVTLDGRELGRLNASQLTDIRKNVIGMGCKYRMCTNRLLSRLPMAKKGNNGFCRFAADICQNILMQLHGSSKTIGRPFRLPLGIRP